ncbi:trypsin-like peptidase domain-containing protein [Streptomyces sp. C10-9-1]|uniref:S1C family serine protease n=1 Tax=Streptomyces sp. C10-9-1 TaxID=1859285 RepID=UPI00211132E1|nr:trypsin-like peptidase domain-containing protein [Streptomyces sp. C10-9-1]MCQ6554446.1 trypsin-like peptidase domain-containing protein [Streptomyces sp. C10-9-1]
MDDGKPTGPKAKWWSRPGVAGRADTAGADAPPGAPAPESPAPGAGQPGADAPFAPEAASPEIPSAPPAPAPGPPPEQPPARAVPLHDPDPYGTPPYGGPGPWAPAPPVQRPVPTPAHGTSVHTPAPAQGPAPGPYAPPPPAVPPGQDGPGAVRGPLPLPAQPPAGHPHQPPAPGDRPQPPDSVWLQYDPWSAPDGPLTSSGEPVPRRRRRGGLLAGALAVALVAGGAGGAIGAYVERNGGFTRLELPQADAENRDRAPDSVAGIAASALPSVVTLHVSGSGEQGTGTGFVLDRRGHILTNNHVVDPAGESGDITVTFSGGETAEATLVGKDSGYDLAVVRVTGVSGLKPLPLGNSDDVRVGDPVVAIGAPFDLQNTVTSGIISAKERPITAGGERGDGSDVSYVDALQTDAPINPGNSGGPLVDAQARVIGINSAIRAADTGGADGGQAGSIGLGFAIPINQGKRVAEELINTGKATHPVIGVSLDMKFPGDGARVGDKGRDGAPSVTPGGPAATAGVRPGDVITRVDGQRVHSGEELIVKIRAHRPGDRLELTLTRAGRQRTVELTLGSADGS